MRKIPEITEDSPFGKAIAEIVSNLKPGAFVFEVGTGCGLGSTMIIHKNLNDGIFRTLEGDYDQSVLARKNLGSIGIGQAWHGVLTRGIRPYFHPEPSSQVKEMWDYERKITLAAPDYTVPTDKISFLLLDGGEFTTDGDFLTLWPFSKVIALDDCNPKKSLKTVYAKFCLEQAGWKLLAGNQEDRNGWAIFERPE